MHYIHKFAVINTCGVFQVFLYLLYLCENVLLNVNLRSDRKTLMGSGYICRE